MTNLTTFINYVGPIKQSLKISIYQMVQLRLKIHHKQVRKQAYHWLLKNPYACPSVSLTAQKSNCTKQLSFFFFIMSMQRSRSLFFALVPKQQKISSSSILFKRTRSEFS
eukprot:TRINITY_DN13817_c1_g1_i1.p1 TRINITY_DN13817_c1_g1~~TRINITY_DN13817_c1_g1_i1.p1  ORF type:complete len:110 (-),score=2.75 TRINITY_DN13817_c1_g1_i1:152-481(-)